MENSSISHEIIFGTLEGVNKIIQARNGSKENIIKIVNEKNIYGSTPLILATQKEDVRIAQLLLQNGAKIDQEDISGQTALQWAVNKNLEPFCDLYLKAKADANHYSADGQPILVNPLLREQNDLVKKLLSFGADTAFALDYVNAKLIGHRYELTGKPRILNPRNIFVELNFEGFYLEFTIGIIMRSLGKFMQEEGSRHFAAYVTVLHKIARMLKAASQIIQYKYTTEGPNVHGEIIRKVLDDDLVVIPVTYEGHAITFVKYGNMLAKCDRGVKHIVDTVIVYDVGNFMVLTPDFLKDLMYNNKSDEYINTEVKKILDLKPIATLPARYQLSGNCSWANIEASVPAMMFMLMFRGNHESRGEIATLKKSIMGFYDAWVEWDKDRILNECIASFEKSDLNQSITTPKNIAKASILAAILFQRCRANHKKELERARKILSILMLAEYRFILKSYQKVYYTKMAGKLGEDYRDLLKICGVNLANL